MSKKFLLALLLAPLAGAALADTSEEVGQWYVVPQLGLVLPDSGRDVDDGVIYGLAFGKHLTEKWSLEANGLFGNNQGQGDVPDLDTISLSLDVLRVFHREQTFSPYLTAGTGWLQSNWSGDRSIEDDFMMQAGVGVFARVWQDPSGPDRLSLRPEFKVRFGGSNATDYILSVGLAYGFGSNGRSAAPVAAAAAVPPSPPPAASPPPPAPVPVAPDSDGDGVLNNRDRCPGTPRGTAVDADGCTRKGSVTLSDVNFENNSSKIKPGSFSSLDTVANYMKSYPRLKVEVQGHTDNTGADVYNMTLSQSRAESVRDYLVSKGVGSSQLTAKGYGESRPVAENKTASGRAQNRRVVLEVLENPGDVEVKR